MIVGPVRAFADHDVGRHARKIGLIGNRDQVEHQLDLRVERILLAPRRLGCLHARGQITVLRKLNAPFDLSHRVEVTVENHFVARTQVQLQRFGTLRDEIKDAPFCLMTAMRSSGVAPSPNNCSKTFAGWPPSAKAEFAFRYDSVAL